MEQSKNETLRVLSTREVREGFVARLRVARPSKGEGKCTCKGFSAEYAEEGRKGAEKGKCKCEYQYRDSGLCPE